MLSSLISFKKPVFIFNKKVYIFSLHPRNYDKCRYIFNHIRRIIVLSQYYVSHFRSYQPVNQYLIMLKYSITYIFKYVYNFLSTNSTVTFYPMEMY